jgi:hypothetical protein
MQNLVAALVLPLVVLFIFLLIFRIVSEWGNAARFAVSFYLVFGVFIAASQVGGAGGCPSWRDGGYWWPIIDWPADIYQNVWNGNVTLRRYLIPRTCEEVPGQPARG